MAVEIASPLGSKVGPLHASEGELRHSLLVALTQDVRLFSQTNTGLLLLTAPTTQQSVTAKWSWLGLLVSYREGILHHEEQERVKGPHYTKRQLISSDRPWDNQTSMQDLPVSFGALQRGTGQNQIMLSETSNEACDNTGCCVRGPPPPLTTITVYPSLSFQLYEFKLSITQKPVFTAISAADLTGLKINLKKTPRHGNKQLTSRNFLNYFTSSFLSKTCRYILRHSKLQSCRCC